MNKHLVHPTETIFHGKFADIANLACNIGYQVLVTKGDCEEPIVSVVLRNPEDAKTMPIIIVHANKYHTNKLETVWGLDTTLIFPNLNSEDFEDRELIGFVSCWKDAAKLADELGKIYIPVSEL